MSTSPASGKWLQGQIGRVSIHGFRSLAQVDDLQLPALTVLIGSNGGGKSNFIRFFEMPGWMMHAQSVLPGFADFELQPAFSKVALRWRGTYGGKTSGAPPSLPTARCASAAC